MTHTKEIKFVEDFTEEEKMEMSIIAEAHARRIADNIDKVVTSNLSTNDLIKLKGMIDKELKLRNEIKLDKAKARQFKLYTALVHIRDILNKSCGIISNAECVGLINEVLDEEMS